MTTQRPAYPPLRMMFEIDPDIRKARTLPSDFYTDDTFFELSKDKIFARTWQFLGKASEIDVLTPSMILAGFLDEPALLVKNATIAHCLSNVCTHRGKILVEEACEANLIRCGYHGRRFSLDGKFLSMPSSTASKIFLPRTTTSSRCRFACGKDLCSLRSIRRRASMNSFNDVAEKFGDDAYDAGDAAIRR